jgi:plastocyanin
MITRVLALGAFAAAVCLAPSPPALQAAGANVGIVNMTFTPSKVTVSLGGTVTWNNQDTVGHTTTSDQSFWDSGTLSPGSGSFAHTFASAGKYRYHCAIHSEMHGTVKVPVRATGAPSTGWRLRWATTKGTGGTTYDVQVRKPGAKSWTTLKTGVTKPSAKYDPSAAGKYAVRARTHHASGTTGWSPATPLTIS